MNVNAMRYIDRFVGVPVTFILTLFDRLLCWRSKQKQTPKRILWIELSEMGSTIIADPAMRKAQQHYDAELFFVIFQKNKPSLNLLNPIPEANIFTIRDHHLLAFLSDVFRFFAWSRRQKIDTSIDLELFSRATAILSYLSGAKNRVGYYRYNDEGLYRGELLTHRVQYNPHQHMAKNFIALVNALSSDQQELPYSKQRIDDDEIILSQATVSAENISAVKAKIQAAYPSWQADQQKILLINPNASELLPQRRWPPAQFIALSQALLTHFSEAIILITGAQGEWEGAEHIRKQVDHPRCINFAGATSFTALPALYQLAALMITNDSGPGHFSAVTALPTIVLFGPETPTLYRSLSKHSTPITAGLACSPCVSAYNHRKTPCKDNVCMRAISVERVLSLCQEKLMQ